LRSKLRQAQQKRRQAISKVNSAIRKFNSTQKRAVVDRNRKARARNARARANQQRVKQELRRLNSRLPTTTTRFSTLRVSVQTVHDAYGCYEEQVGADTDHPLHAELLDLAEREDANSLGVMNALLDDDTDTHASSGALQETSIVDELLSISSDLDQRWRGAVFALNPTNPDACRHFCSSAREVFTKMVHLKTPDAEVLRALPSCEVTDRGRPTRRSRIQFVLGEKGMNTESLEEFVERDITNILELFDVLNSGTHGDAGKYSLPKLVAIKTRVEQGLLFLARVIS